MQALTSSTFRTPTTHIPPAAYTSGLPTPPPPTHIPPAAYPSGLPIPPTQIPCAAYPSGLPNPCPLPPMNALGESITDFSVPLMLAYNFKET